jgi:hypothetical protein
MRGFERGRIARVAARVQPFAGPLSGPVQDRCYGAVRHHDRPRGLPAVGHDHRCRCRGCSSWTAPRRSWPIAIATASDKVPIAPSPAPSATVASGPSAAIANHRGPRRRRARHVAGVERIAVERARHDATPAFSRDGNTPPPSIPPATGSTVARVASKLMVVGGRRRRQPRAHERRRQSKRQHDLLRCARYGRPRPTMS